MKKNIIMLCLLLALFFSGCVGINPFGNEKLLHDKSWEVLYEMTLEEKIGQLFFINPEGFTTTGITYNDHEMNVDGVTVIDEDFITALQEYPVGGIILFGRNIDNPNQLKKMTITLQSSSKIPLFIGIDEEGGRVARIGQNENFDVKVIPPMGELVADNNISSVRNAGKTIGKYLSYYGFNVDFAPVADINTNPENIVIGDRAFGSDPFVVAKMAAAFSDGLHKQNIMNAIKHFPGHGDTKGDTHDGFVSVNKTWEELLESELIPFIYNMDKTDMVMVAHITAPKVTTDWRPSSLSQQMIQGKLRNELGYDGVVITDAMDMDAISNDYSSANAAIRAIEAGVDIILVPYNFLGAYNGVLGAVKNGRISEERINESVYRILLLKMKYNLFK